MSGPPHPVRVTLVNDYPVIVQGLTRLLESDARLAVVESVSGVDPEQPADLVLFDAFASTSHLYDVVARLHREGSGQRLVLYSWNLTPEAVSDALDAGVHGCVSKALDGARLADALVRVHEGEVVVDPRTSSSENENGDWPGRAQGLSAREAEVVALITQGNTNEQIAAENYLSINSVKSYIRSAYRKMGVERRSQAVLWGVENGMLPSRSRNPAATQSGRDHALRPHP